MTRSEEAKNFLSAEALVFDKVMARASATRREAHCIFHFSNDAASTAAAPKRAHECQLRLCLPLSQDAGFGRRLLTVSLTIRVREDFPDGMPWQCIIHAPEIGCTTRPAPTNRKHRREFTGAITVFFPAQAACLRSPETVCSEPGTLSTRWVAVEWSSRTGPTPSVVVVVPAHWDRCSQPSLPLRASGAHGA